MRQRERGDRGQELAEPSDQQHQAQHEQQVIDAEQDVLNAEADIGAQHHQRPGCSGTMKLGLEGVRRAVRTLPSALSIRTSTSVSVPSSPSIAIRCPSSPRVAAHPPVLDESAAGLHQWSAGR